MNLKETAIGIELGSTRIKAVMIGKNHEVLAQGDYVWENSFIDGVWTYSLEDVRTGLQYCFAELKMNVKEKYDTVLTTTGAIGISAMMHGYLWSIAHLYQAILNKEEHVSDIAYITTLAGYVHFVLTGERVMGIGEASGMFPIDSEKLCYDEQMVKKFNECTGLDLLTMLPQIKLAGENAGVLTEDGALYLDPSGKLEAGIPVAPCEGDAGTGMVATNSVRVKTGNVSAGTSDFAMVVTDKKLKRHREIDMVTTPSGKTPILCIRNCSKQPSGVTTTAADFSAITTIPAKA